LFGEKRLEPLIWTTLHLHSASPIYFKMRIAAVRSLIFERQEELMPYCVRFQRDCGADKKILGKNRWD